MSDSGGSPLVPVAFHSITNSHVPITLFQDVGIQTE